MLCKWALCRTLNLGGQQAVLVLTLWALPQSLTGEERQGDSEELTMSIWTRTVGNELMPLIWGAVVGWSSRECVPGLNKHHSDWPSLGSGMNCEGG